MKILHTSDWHLGHTLYGYDRTEEQQDMLQQIVNIVSEEKPDVFLLSGDVCHTQQPSAAVQKMLAEALVAIHRSHKEMVIIATAGNHDSSSKHDIFHTPWKDLNVHTIGKLHRDDPMQHVINIPNMGIVVAIPYVLERSMPEDYVPNLLQQVAENNPDNLPIVLMMHTTIAGSDFKGHDQNLLIGGIDSINLKSLGKDYDYLALGHIHCPQAIGFNHRVRYSGTPLAVNFDETYAHSVCLVTLDKHKDVPNLELREITNPRPLITLPDNDEYATWSDAKELLAAIPNDQEAYVRLRVKYDETFPSNAQSEAMQLVSDKACRFCYIQLQRDEELRDNGVKAITVSEFAELNPIEVVENYFSAKKMEFDDDIRSAFEEIMKEIHEEEHN